MRLQLPRAVGFAACTLLLALAGCGGRSGPPAAEEQAEGPSAPSSLQAAGSVITVAAPDGSWRFEARSEHVEAASLEGPYDLTPADCRYEMRGRPPITMRAERANINKASGRVVLEGSVWVASANWMLEGPRVEYDLNAGKVVAPARTKFTFGPPPPAAGAADQLKGDERP